MINRRNQKIGTIMVFVPGIIMIVVLVLFAIINVLLTPAPTSSIYDLSFAPSAQAQTIFGSDSEDSTYDFLETKSPVPLVLERPNSSLRTLVLAWTNFLLGWVGLISVLLMFVFIPWGIYKVIQPEIVEGEYDLRSGKGPASEVPSEIQGWNWAAAFLAPVWGVYHRVWWFLLVFVPFINIIWWIIMGMKGNEWAWRRNKWESIAEFQSVQKRWGFWAIFYLLAFIILYSLFFISTLT